MICDKNSVIIERFQELVNSSGKTRQTIAKDLSCDTSTVTKQYNGDMNISVDYLVKYAKYFNVSTDYLLGLTNEATNNTEMRAITDYTGLSGKAINNLNKLLKQFKGEILGQNAQKEIEEIEKENLEKPEDSYDFDYITNSSIYQAQLILKAINEVLSKDDASKFFELIALYLYADMDIEKQELYGIFDSKYNNMNLAFDFDVSLLEETFLLKINRYLQQWQNKQIKLIDLQGSTEYDEAARMQEIERISKS